MNKRIKVLVSAVLAAVMLVLCIPFTAAAASTTQAIIASEGTLAADSLSISWTFDDFTWVTEKNTSTTAIRTSDTNSFRVYKDTKTTITALGGKTISKVIITADYADKVLTEGSVPAGATLSVNDKVSTLTFATPVSSFVINAAAQWRVKTIELVYAGDEGSGSEGEGGSDDTPTFVKPTTPEAIVDALYALESGESLAEGPYTLEGVVKSIDTAYDSGYKNVTVTIIVGDMTDKPVKCYRMKGDDAETVIEGDTIKVTGQLKNYNGTKEFDAGCTFVTVKKAEKPFEKPTTPEAIVNALYALASGETLPGGNYTLTGKITKIDTPYDEGYKNITVTIVVGDMTDKPIICFRLKGEGADALKVGDTIEVTGTLVDYSGKKEFNSGCTFTLVEAAPDEGGEDVTPPTGGDEGGEDVTPPTGGDQGGEDVTPPTTNPETGDSVVAYVAMAVVALFGIAYVSKKR